MKGMAMREEGRNSGTVYEVVEKIHAEGRYRNLVGLYCLLKTQMQHPLYSLPLDMNTK
jgi:hypothetical protein